MTDNELLLAISEMLDPIRDDIREIKKEVKEVKREVDEIKLRVKKIELRQETDIIPPLNNIQACYTSTYDRYKDSVEDYEAMKQDISILKHALVQHCLNNSEKQCLIFVTGQGGGRRQCGGIVD